MDTQHFIKAVANQGKFALDWRNWGYGLFSGAIGGAASGGVAWASEAIAKGAGADIHVMNLKELGIVCASSGLFAALAYLKQSPLPSEIQVVTTTVSDTHQETTVTTPAPTETKP